MVFDRCIDGGMARINSTNYPKHLLAPLDYPLTEGGAAVAPIIEPHEFKVIMRRKYFAGSVRLLI